MGGAATASRFHIWVGDFKACAIESVDEIDDRAHEAADRFGVDVDLDPLRFDD